MEIYTIGHSTRSLQEFIQILKAYNISQLVDVRSIPKSHHTPQFNKEELEKDLPAQNITYHHLDLLGGRRHTTKKSINTGWHNASFRGYADYMQTPNFQTGIDQLIALARGKKTAIMCAEVVPWRCHRSMIGDALLIRDIDVIDIFDDKKTQSEKLTSFARAKGTNLTYPPE